MSRREEIIAKKLNSVGLEVNADFRDALLDYFNEEENDHSDNDDNSDANDDEPDISQHAPERHIFSIGCSDDNGSLAELDNKEKSAVKKFTKTQCCSLKCSEIFPKEVIIRSRINSRELNYFSKYEHINYLHVCLLGSMNSCLATGPDTQKARNKNASRQKVRGHFYFQGKSVCRTFFLFVYDVSRKTYRKLFTQVYTSDGIVPKQHGNVQKTSLLTSLSLQSREKAVKFIENFAVQNAIVQPGRVPGFKNPDLLLIPCEFTKKSVHGKYAESVSDEDRLPYSTFTELWREFLPNICIQKPRTDLCTVCKMDSLALLKLKSLDDEKRHALLNRSLAHLNLVDQERSYYKEAIQVSKTEIANKLQPGHSSGNVQAFDGVMHYSFDYFQQVHVPHDPDQVGALYFLTPYKVGLFGIMCEAL